MGTGTTNSLKRYKNSLVTKHRLLDKDIKEAYIKRVDDETIKQMKTEKLVLKEKIVNIEKQLELEE